MGCRVLVCVWRVRASVSFASPLQSPPPLQGLLRNPGYSPRCRRSRFLMPPFQRKTGSGNYQQSRHDRFTYYHHRLHRQRTPQQQVCLDMKGALVCLRSLGLNVQGPLEDPAVARWLAEPPVEDTVPLQQQQQQQQKRALKKRKAPLPPPRAPPASLILERWVDGSGRGHRIRLLPLAVSHAVELLQGLGLWYCSYLERFDRSRCLSYRHGCTLAAPAPPRARVLLIFFLP